MNRHFNSNNIPCREDMRDVFTQMASDYLEKNCACKCKSDCSDSCLKTKMKDSFGCYNGRCNCNRRDRCDRNRGTNRCQNSRKNDFWSTYCPPNTDPCKSLCKDPCKDPCKEPCKIPCKEPCKELCVCTIKINNTLFVDEQYGSDQVAERENETKPWKTIQAALNSPTLEPGDTIYVQPGNYNVPTLVVTSNINFYFTKGTIINSTNGPIFTFNNVTSVVRGYGVFISDGGLLPANGGIVQSIDSNIIFEGETATVIGASIAFNINGGSVKINVISVVTNTGEALVIDNAVDLYWNSQSVLGGGPIFKIQTDATGSAKIQSQYIEGYNISLIVPPLLPNIIFNGSNNNFLLEITGQELKTTSNFEAIWLTGGTTIIEFQNVTVGNRLIKVEAVQNVSSFFIFTADNVIAILPSDTQLITNEGSFSNINVKILQVSGSQPSENMEFPLIDLINGGFIYKGNNATNLIANTIFFNVGTNTMAGIDVDNISMGDRGQIGTAIVSGGALYVKNRNMTVGNNCNAIRVISGETTLDIGTISAGNNGIYATSYGDEISDPARISGYVNKINTIYAPAIKSESQGNIELVFQSINTSADKCQLSDACIQFIGQGNGRLIGNTITANYCKSGIHIGGPVDQIKNAEFSLRCNDIFINDAKQAILIDCVGNGGANISATTLRVNDTPMGAVVCDQNSIVYMRIEVVEAFFNKCQNNRVFKSGYGAFSIRDNSHFHGTFGEITSCGPTLFVKNTTNSVWFKADTMTNITNNVPNVETTSSDDIPETTDTPETTDATETTCDCDDTCCETICCETKFYETLSNGTSVVYLDMCGTIETTNTPETTEAACNCNVTVGGYMRTLQGRYCIEYVPLSGDGHLRILNSIFVTSDLDNSYTIYSPDLKSHITLAHSIGNNDAASTIGTFPPLLSVYVVNLGVF